MIPFLLIGILAAAPDPAAVAEALTRGHHVPTRAALEAARDPNVQSALHQVALDERRPRLDRIRALHLAGLGKRPELLWRTLERSRDLRLRAEAQRALRRRARLRR